MPAPPPSSSTAARGARSDGEQSRERLLLAALGLFAERGYAKTSTREIAEAAGTNLAAISYYFGDKAGLYRAAFSVGQNTPAHDVAAFSDPALTLHEALRALYTQFIGPLRQGELALQCMKLHMREMLEPTGVWEAEIRDNIAPRHSGLTRLLRRHLGATRSDVEVERLTAALTGLGLQVQVCADVTSSLAPALMKGERAFERWIERLADYGVALVEAERARRAAPANKAARRRAPGASPR